MYKPVKHSTGQDTANLPIGLSFDEAETLPLSVLIIFAIIYTLLTGAHAYRSWQNGVLIYLIYMIAFGINAAGFLTVAIADGRALSLRAISNMLIIMAPTILIIRWCQSMERMSRLAYIVYLIMHVILSITLLGAVILVGYELPQAIDGRGLDAVYLLGLWLERGTVFSLVSLALLLVLEMDVARWIPIQKLLGDNQTDSAATTTATNATNRSVPSSFMLIKRRQLYGVAGQISLLWLSILLAILQVPFVDFAASIIIGFSCLFPSNALCRYQQGPPPHTRAMTTVNSTHRTNHRSVDASPTSPHDIV
ncbi:hypothetical protein BDF22DRAFT_271997 [Syncephalis plumigaleata]|nr:hypothetical protein BDF22DRAFT_271997 [Syncephalis plumigaleata]